MNHREIFNSKLGEISSSTDKYFKESQSYCDGIDIPAITKLTVFEDLYDNLHRYEHMLESMQVNFKIDTIKMLIDREYSSKLDGVESERNSLMLALRTKIEKAMDEKRAEIRSINDGIREKNNALKSEIDAANSKYRQLERKRQRLLEYSTEILQLCADYGIKVSDINISNDMFSMEELDIFYEQFYTFIALRAQKKNNPIGWLRDKVNDSSTILAIIAGVALLLVATPVIDILSIGMILYIIYSQSIQESLVKKYTIMAGLSFNVSPMEFGVVKEVPDDMIEQEVSEDIDIDSEPEFQELLEEVNDSMENITDDDIRTDMSKAIAEYTKDYPKMQKELESSITSINERRNKILSNISDVRKLLKDRESILKSEVKLLGQEFSESGVISTSVKLGVNENTLIYETVDVGMQNILFRSKGNDPRELDKFIKVMLANYYCNVRPGYFDVTVYDPNGMGRSMAGFYSTEMEQVFQISNDNLDEILKGLKDYTDTVIKTTKGRSINEYNAKAMQDERLCLNYKLLLVLSQPKTMEENEALRSFIEYSADLGVFVWMVTDTVFPKTKVFNKPFEGISQPINIDPFDFPVEVVSNMYKKFKSLVSPSLMWNDFKDKAIPDDKIWTYNADEFIDLDPGYEDGDSSKSKGYTLGNTGDIHALCVGGTGAGKSVFINNLIANVVTKYSPNAVRLWLVDFKGSEFNFYLKKPEIGHNYILPHIDACLCTSDPDYSVSLFSALRGDAEERYKFLMNKGFKNMYEYNKAMRKAGTPEKCLPRILFIADEFQVIFEKTDGKAQDSLKKDITYISKVARACGIHLLFCSQSMKGTVSADILSQFTLRFGLRCPMEVSMEVMGTKLSGDIREKNGYLYVSSIDDKKKELQKRYRTPFIPDGQLLGRIELVTKKAQTEGFSRDEAIVYDETTKHGIKEIDDLYEHDLKNMDVKNLFILGERMVYSRRGRRSNLILGRENNQHIFSAFSNTKDTIMFFNTLMENLKYNGSNGGLIINAQIKDLGYVCGVDKYVDEDNALFNLDEQTPSTLLPIFQQIMAARKEEPDADSLSPLYIVCIGWDKAMYFGIDTQYKITDQYATLLQTCGTVNMHFIFISTSKSEIPKSIITACSHRIAGKVDEVTSTTLLDSVAAYKTYEMEDGYMFYFTSGSVERLKIYVSEIMRTVKERSIRI